MCVSGGMQGAASSKHIAIAPGLSMNAMHEQLADSGKMYP